MTNRLQLNFSLQTLEERTKFMQNYINSPNFQNKPLTEDELETCSNFILWGKDKDGKNGVQKKNFEIQTKNSTWNKKDTESLDALLETPTFNEALIVAPTQARTKVTREVFSREEALKLAPDSLIPSFKALFKEIDELDLLLNYYDLLHNKRKKQPREELLKRFSLEEQKRLQEKVKHINQYKYLKLRHQLVELRQQQYLLRDSYSNYIQIDDTLKVPVEENKLIFDADMNVYPLGLKYKNSSFFINLDDLLPNNFNDKQINTIIKKYWYQQKNTTKFYFDFENQEHIYHLLLNYFEFKEDTYEEKNLDTFSYLLDTLKYYISQSNLDDCQREILELKMKHYKNQEIIEIINPKYNKNYTANYISTIFRQKIIKKIVECVSYHKEIILNLPFPEEFKQCSTCKKFYLRSNQNFVKKTRAKDGLTNRCKKCDKKERQFKKGGNK